MACCTKLSDTVRRKFIPVQRVHSCIIVTSVKCSKHTPECVESSPVRSSQRSAMDRHISDCGKSRNSMETGEL